MDGSRSFAESSNVVLKNAVVLGLWEAALQNESFFHPRFCLMDNIEDKGMEAERKVLPRKPYCLKQRVWILCQ